MMMQTMEEPWTDYGENMQWDDGSWGNLNAGNMNAWWDPSMDPTMDPSLCSYGQGMEFEAGFQDWTGYDGSEDWSRRVPKCPPPNAPAPGVEGMAMQQTLETQALIEKHMYHQSLAFDMEAASSMLAMQKPVPRDSARGMALPPGLRIAEGRSAESQAAALSGALPRPKPLGLASMMESPFDLKDPVHRSITPATTAPPTPASSMSEFEASSPLCTLPSSGAIPGSDRIWNDAETSTDLGSGYSLFGAAPWLSLQQPRAEDFSLPAKVQISLPVPIGMTPAKVKLEELLCREDHAHERDSPTGPPPGLFTPGSLLGPPGLEDPVLSYKMAKRPPGLELPSVAELPEEALLSTTSAASTFASMLTPASSALPEDKCLESVTVEQSQVHGMPCTRAVWRIVQLRGRLKTSLGKPVVSPPFSVLGLGDLRLMVTPDAKGTLEGMRGKSKQSHFAKMLSQGPLECTLKVKVPCTTIPVVKFYLTVGPHCRQGPFTCDFMQHTVHGCNDFDCDWLKQVDEEGCLCVGLEIVEICTDKPRPA